MKWLALFLTCAVLFIGCGNKDNTKTPTQTSETKPRIQTMYDLDTRKKILREVIYAERRAEIEAGVKDVFKPKKEAIQKSDELEEQYLNEIFNKYKITRDDVIDIQIEAQKNLQAFPNPPVGKLSD